MLEAVRRAVDAFARLPGVGRRSAERIAYRLARDPSGRLAREVVDAVEGLCAGTALCPLCGRVTESGRDACRLCADPDRDPALLCVVEQPEDIERIEETGAFRGRYHALMGKLSPARGEGVRQLRLRRLVERVQAEPVREILLALNADVESDATCAFLRDMLAPGGVRVTRLAHGIPAGSGVSYADPVTLSRAVRSRQDV
jgi:recombination protein RecR